MKTNTIIYDPATEEEARSDGWYLSVRDKFVLKIAKEFANFNLSKKILDAGCGTGGVMSSLSQSGILTVGNDTSLESLIWGKKKGRIVNGVQASVSHLPFKDEIFDISICSEVLEHVDDDLSTLKELGRVTKHRIIFTVPAHRYLWTDSDDILLHKRRYSKSELSALIKKSGMRIVKLEPFGIIPGFLVILYKFFFGTKSKVDKDTKDLPFTSRYKIPRFIEKKLTTLFSLELWLSKKGLVLWGHSWWGCIEKKELVSKNSSFK